MDMRTVDRDSRGIMEQIRELLATGKSTAEVIRLGYKPPTVYKVQRQMRNQSPAVLAHPASAPRHEIAVVRTSDGDERIVWHPERPVACPGCGTPVGHWDICPLCNRLLPGGCACPEGAPPTAKGYTFQQLREALAGR